MNSEIEKLNGEKFSLISELDAFKMNRNFNQNNENNNTTSVTNSNTNSHHFLNHNKPNITSSINGDFTSTLSVGTLRSGNSNPHNYDDFHFKLRSNNNNDYRPDELPISSRSEAFNNKQPNTKKHSLLDNNENSPSAVSLHISTE